jgi:hypothetical protein
MFMPFAADDNNQVSAFVLVLVLVLVLVSVLVLGLVLPHLLTLVSFVQPFCSGHDDFDVGNVDDLFSDCSSGEATNTADSEGLSQVQLHHHGQPHEWVAHPGGPFFPVR